MQLVRQTVRACLISQVSRANLYRIAGILVADRRDEGAHIGTSLALAYVAALREAFLMEISMGERVPLDSRKQEREQRSHDAVAKSALLCQLLYFSSPVVSVWQSVDTLFTREA